MAARFGLVQKQNGSQIPLESIKIQADLQGFTAQVVAFMKYTNNEENPIEAIYIFPLDEQAAVCGFEATVDGRTIVAQVQGKEEARDTYDDALSSGQNAFLLEESDESSDIFQISVGNLPPKKEALIELRFVTELSVETEGRVVFVLPTVLNPRYSPADSAPSLSTQIPQAAIVDSPYSFELDMKVKAISTITEITSPTNALKVEIDEIDKAQAKVSLEGAHNFNQDVAVHILTKEPFKPQAIVENGIKIKDRKDKEGFMASPVVMLNLYPEFKNPESSEIGEFVFVIDRSGSMRGSRIKSARDTLLLFLKSLPDGCYFNVVGFGSSFTTLFKKSQQYNDENLKKATDLAQSMEADLGGTEILQPLQWVFSQPAVKGHPRQLFVLSDGGVGNTAQVIQLVRKHSSTGRCFTFGIGSGVSTALINGVARAGKGKAEFVTDDDDRLQAKVIKTLKRALQPVITDVSVTWDLPQGWVVQQIPSTLSPLFSGDRLVIYGLLKSSENASQDGETVVRLQGTLSQHERMEHLITFPTPTTSITTDTVVDPNSSAILHCLAAQKFIQVKQDDLSDKYGAEVEDVTSRIISVSKSANVASKFTSFVAVDKENHQPVSGALRKRIVPSFLHWAVPCSAVPFSDATLCASAATLCAVPRHAAPRLGGGMLHSFDADNLYEAPKRKKKGARKTVVKGASSVISVKLPKNSSCAADLSLISLQKASGAWDLTDELVLLCGKSRDNLIKDCPVEIAGDTAEGKLLWATALALVLLMAKFLDQKDEWEMIAEKAKKWMKKNVPADIKYDSVLQSAANAIGVQI
ncbi:von Willebrand factor A domain-containing protein 5A-like isoform X1 [Montipora foliosa]|uniref:von Willebrand factor A domain-containing protein 5A-like isoform X1 n=2 Tax=Montipora foliosa TaxID=591990 RepID=UPI0035F16F77